MPSWPIRVRVARFIAALATALAIACAFFATGSAGVQSIVEAPIEHAGRRGFRCCLRACRRRMARPSCHAPSSASVATCRDAPTGSPMSCRQSKKQTRSYPSPENPCAARLRTRLVLRDAGIGGRLAGLLNRRAVVVETEETRVRERLRHHDRRRAMAAADVGDRAPASQFFLDAVERRDPRRNEWLCSPAGRNARCRGTGRDRARASRLRGRSGRPR